MGDGSALNNRERMELYYKIVAGGARLKLFESVIDFELVELIGQNGELSQEEIIKKLKLVPVRAKKWLYLLCSEQFLTERYVQHKNIYMYSLGPVLAELSKDEDKWWFYKQMVYSWRLVANEPIVKVLQGAPVTTDINWPPKTIEDSASLEEWMRRTAKALFSLLERYLPVMEEKHILDVGGGDGTIACILANRYPYISFTIFNVLESIKLAQKKIEKENLSHRIKTVAGNFLIDEKFHGQYDVVMFSRVLCDWPLDVAKKLLKMAYDALVPGGQLIICEPFKDGNDDLMLVWEFRYMFWDSFGKAVFKEYNTYKNIAEEIGFNNCEISPMNDEGVYRLLRAIKRE